MNLQIISKKLLLALLLLPLCYINPIKSEAYIFTSALSFVSAGGLIVGALVLKNSYKSLLTNLEEQLIQDWIAKNNLNHYGEPKDTVYSQGNPLSPNQSPVDYIKNIFPKKPWFEGYKKMIKPISGMPLTIPAMIVSGIILLGIGKYFAHLAWNKK